MSFTAQDIYGIEFSNAPIGRRGYAKNEVDRFVDRIAKTLDEQDDLTAAEVHHVMFAKPLLGRRGYDEREVDDFLDTVEDQLATTSGRSSHPLPRAREEAQAIDAVTEPNAVDRGQAG
ncbi:MAG TPA: DivIVA domain-containing protein [Amycolatopsis sp.]|nr:DivIVA domain-containing protein [Amycolatopsis sp.]